MFKYIKFNLLKVKSFNPFCVYRESKSYAVVVAYCGAVADNGQIIRYAFYQTGLFQGLELHVRMIGPHRFGLRFNANLYPYTIWDAYAIVMILFLYYLVDGHSLSIFHCVLRLR